MGTRYQGSEEDVGLNLHNFLKNARIGKYGAK